MIHRDDPAGLLVITQPAHALMTGAIARAWGNRQFGAVAPREEVCAAAALHDLGWLDWEAAPTLNPDTGLPHNFDALPTALHFEIWTRGPRLALSLGRYLALLVSLHGSYLFEENAQRTAGQTDQIRAFLREQRGFQQSLIASLQTDARFAEQVEPQRLAANRAIVRVTDLISLLLCLGARVPRVIAAAPSADGPIDLTYSPDPADPTRVRLSPWPLSHQKLTLVFQGQRLGQRWTSESQMRHDLRAAPWVTLRAELLPGAA